MSDSGIIGSAESLASLFEAQGADLFTLRDGKIVIKQALRKQRPLLNG